MVGAQQPIPVPTRFTRFAGKEETWDEVRARAIENLRKMAEKQAAKEKPKPAAFCPDPLPLAEAALALLRAAPTERRERRERRNRA
jgi:hypothetical protein